MADAGVTGWNTLKTRKARKIAESPGADKAENTIISRGQEGRKHITKEPNGRAEKRSKRTKASDGATKGDNEKKREDNDDKNRKKGRNDNDT